MKAFALAFFLLTPSAFAIQAQPVPVPEDASTAPQMEFAGTGIGTLGFGKKGDQHEAKGTINYSDSSLVVGAAQRLYQGATGSFALGGVTTEEGSLFLHQAFVDFQSEKFEALLGRSDNPSSHIVDFPTLRGEDLVTLTNPLNPYSNGANGEEHRYSNVASFTLNQGLTWFENVHVQHLPNSAGIDSASAVNSFGFTFYYLGAPGLEILERVPSWGFGFDQITMHNSAPNGLHQAYAGGTLRLNESVTNPVELRAQEVVSWGSRLRTISSANDSFQANANTTTAALVYRSSPFGHPGWQVALTAAHKHYFDVPLADSYGGALTGVKRLGQGFDLVLQYQGQWRDRALANAQSHGLSYEQSAEVGFTFNFDAILNEHITPRRTLLNQRHQYVPN